jgi:hypothetical protein
VFKTSGVWSEIFLSRGSTVAIGDLSSQSVETSTLSNFSKVGSSSGPTHVYWRPDKSISLRSSDSITVLKRFGH